MANILNWPTWAVLAVEEQDREYRISAAPPEPTACPHCGTVGEFQGFGGKEQTFLDLPVHAKRVGIVIHRKRRRCKSCSRTFYDPIPELDETRQMSKRLVEHIRRESLDRPFVHVADAVGVTEGTVRHIFNEHTKKVAATYSYITPATLGIDELYLLGEMRCILTNVEHRTIVDLLPKRDKKTVQAYLAKMKDGHKIDVVVMDMWRPYREAAAAVLPNAMVVVDKFHVVRMATDALDSVRKKLRDELTDKQRRTLKRDRYVLLRRRHDLTDKDKLLLSTWRENFPQLGAAYDAKEAFFDIYQAADRAAAEAAYDRWRSTLPTSLEAAYKDLITAMTNWRAPIFNYFDTGLTNAYTEAMNGVAKAVNGLGRGYSFDSIRAKMLFVAHRQKRLTWRDTMSDKALREGGKETTPTPLPAMAQLIDWSEIKPEDLGRVYQAIAEEGVTYEGVTLKDVVESVNFGTDMSTFAAEMEAFKKLLLSTLSYE
jgi:transposase